MANQDRGRHVKGLEVQHDHRESGYDGELSNTRSGALSDASETLEPAKSYGNPKDRK